MTVYIGNLSFQAEEDDLRQVFSEYGTVTNVFLPLDRDSGKKRGFAFVDMSTDAEESKAIETLDGAEWMGRQIKVNKAKPRESRESRGHNRSRGFSG
jgi:RNA recognition motif-containing protein